MNCITTNELFILSFFIFFLPFLAFIKTQGGKKDLNNITCGGAWNGLKSFDRL